MTDSIDAHIKNAEALLAYLKGLKAGTPPPVPTPVPPGPVTVDTQVVTVSEAIKQLAAGTNWPTAVDPALICSETEEDKMSRAEVIADLAYAKSLDGKKVLDFGCGEGHVARQFAKQKVAAAVGYDIAAGDWKQFDGVEKLLLTTDFDRVMAAGPYDLIVMYDVLDHVVNEEPLNALRRVRSLLAPNGEMFVRCHPWCSRHGTHLYKTFNKAFAHLTHTEAELGGAVGLPTYKIIHPLQTYHNWFQAAGFKIVSEFPENDPVEPFFSDTPVVAERIKKWWAESGQPDLKSGKIFPEFQMAMSFIDYVLN